MAYLNKETAKIFYNLLNIFNQRSCNQKITQLVGCSMTIISLFVFDVKQKLDLENFSALTWILSPVLSTPLPAVKIVTLISTPSPSPLPFPNYELNIFGTLQLTSSLVTSNNEKIGSGEFSSLIRCHKSHFGLCQ